MDKDVLQEIRYTNILKGVAILAVILLHVLSTIPTQLIVTPTRFPAVLFLDQIARFCVPLFVAVSGFGLMRKYMHKPFGLKDFLQRRFLRLFPLYFLWAGVSLVLFAYSHTWDWMGSNMSLFFKLFFGKTDYHHYFVLLIAQLYFLFPILFFAYRKYPKIILASALVLQFFVYSLFSAHFQGIVTLPFRLTDQRMYLFSFSWIWYFVLGMHLAIQYETLRSKKYWTASLILFVSGILWTVHSGQQALPWTDTITVLRFTRFPVLLFATGSILLTLGKQRTWEQFGMQFLAWCGKHSYLIFLSHLLLVRATLGWYFGFADLWSVGLLTFGTILTLIVSVVFRLE